MDGCAFLRHVFAAAALACAACANAQPAAERPASHDHGASGFVLFLHGEAHHIASPKPVGELNEDSWLAGDLVVAFTRDRFRLFGEYLLSPAEHDLERFQLGYEPLANTIVWLGRFHQPASAWNTEHHHGRYLQTAITRPSIEVWEDEEGLLPQHVTGALVDARLAVGASAGLQLAAGAGLGPRIDGEGLDTFDLLDMHARGRRVSWSGRIGFLPDYIGATQFGLLLARHRIPVVDAAVASALGANSVRQNIVGAFADWHGEAWRVLAAAYDVRVALQGTGVTRRERFLAGYVQVERRLPRAFTAYGREENSSRAARSRYVTASHDEFLLRRFALGLRNDFRPRHALTLEVARSATLRAHQTEYRLQWSAALP